MRVLIIEDDRNMVGLLQKGLEEENHIVSLTFEGRAGLELAQSYEFDVIVLDWMLPEMEGTEVARRIRKSGKATPILMLTARDAVPEIVKGLEAGADDYLTKPFSFAEFLARLRALGRRSSDIQAAACLEIADLTLDPSTRQVVRGGARNPADAYGISPPRIPDAPLRPRRLTSRYRGSGLGARCRC